MSNIEDISELKKQYAKVKLVRMGINLLCPICHSSVTRRFLIVGPQSCLNTSCPTNNLKLIDKGLDYKHRVISCRILKKLINGGSNVV
jgi:hypothetical protein